MIFFGKYVLFYAYFLLSRTEILLSFSGWGPGGYSGIQQISDTRKVAIFSMWDEVENVHTVQKISSGPGVIVSPFSGEGTGLKSMKDFDWKENEDITFIVDGRLTSNDIWQCSCHYLVKGEKHHMATYERAGKQKPLDQPYSFIEDWMGQGGKSYRRAIFKNAIFKSDGRIVHLNSADFTKNPCRCERERPETDKAVGGVSEDGEAFYLATGGRILNQDEIVANRTNLCLNK